MPFNRSGPMLTNEEISPSTSLMAREVSLGPSDAPCLGETSTAHGDSPFSVSIIHIKTVYVSKSSVPATAHVLNLQSTNLPIPELNPSRQSLSTDLICRRRTHTEAWPTNEKLGFPLAGLEPSFGPFSVQRLKPIFSDPCLNIIKPRSVTLYSSPFTCLLCFHDLRSRRPSSRLEAINCIWRCEYYPQTMVLNSPLASFYETLILKSIYETLSLKLTSIAHMVFYENQLGLSRRTLTVTSLPAYTFFDYALKEFGIDLIQRPQPGVVLYSLVSPKPSRTLFYYSWKTSRIKLRTALLLDLKDPRRPSFPVMERTSAPPSSFKERNRTSFLVAPLEIASAINEAKNPFQTSQNPMIVTISKIPEMFAEVSSTHHDLACGMLLFSFRLRDSMDLSSKLYVYLMYVVIACALKLCTLCSPLLGLFE